MTQQATLPPTVAPTLTPTGAPEFPPPVPSRTPQLLRRLQAIVILAALLAGAVAAWVISDLRTDLASAPNLAQQYARLGQVQHNLDAAADFTARSVILGESATGANAVAAAKALTTANGLLVDAAKDRPQDAGDLRAMGESVVQYSLNLGSAVGLPRADAQSRLKLADTQRDDLLDSIGEFQARLATEASARPWSQSTPWTVLACLAMLAVVVWASWLVARRTHRVLNLGLVGTGIAVLLVLAMSTAAQSTAGSASDSSRGTQFTHVVNATTAVRQLDAAQRVLTTAVLTQGWSQSSASAYTKALKAAGQAGGLEGLTSLNGFDSARQSLADQMTKGDWKGAAATLTADDAKSLGTTADNFRKSADRVADAAVTAAATAPESARAGMAFELFFAIVFAVIGAAAGAFGLDQRLREYR